MDIPTRVELIERVPLFSGLDPDDLANIAGEARECLLHPGDVLFRQGDVADTSYVIAWGRLRLDQTTADGQNVVIRYLSASDLVGTVAVIRDIPFPATPTAVEDTLVLAWGKNALFDQMARHPVVSVNVAKVMGGRIEELQTRLHEAATQRVERRIAATLLRLVRQSGKRTEKGVEIPFTLSRQNLAEMTATTLHTVSRTLSAWQEEGIVTGRRADHIVILKPHRLVQIAEDA